jgi:hypothetical protein
MINFFTEPDPVFGGVSYATGIFWLVMLATGVYLLTRWRESNPIRYRFGRQAGLVSIVLSVIGLALLALNAAEVAPFNIRLGIYLMGFISLGYVAYALYTYLSRLPAQVAATKSVRTVRAPGSRSGARTYPANTAPAEPRAPRPPRPVATTTRREARRDKKRKSR